MCIQRLSDAASAGFASAIAFIRSKNACGKMCGKMSSFLAACCFMRLSPNLGGDLHDARELRLLLGMPERIALDRAGEAALRAERQLLERRMARRLLDLPQQLALLLYAGRFRGHQPERDPLASLRQARERLEAAGSRGIVLEEVAVHVDP